VKKTYKTPSAEKIEFDYSESVEACSPNCKDPTHFWHWFNNPCVEPNPSTTAPSTTEPQQQTNDPYYAPGWGLNC